jgi:hypothetical protein
MSSNIEREREREAYPWLDRAREGGILFTRIPREREGGILFTSTPREREGGILITSTSREGKANPWLDGAKTKHPPETRFERAIAHNPSSNWARSCGVALQASSSMLRSSAGDLVSGCSS